MNDSINKLSIRHGLLIGGITAALTIVFYFINPLMQYTNFVVPIISLIIVITLLVILSLDVRRNVGGFWTFGQAFLSLLIMSVCITVISVLLSFIIIKFVDPALPQKINDALADVTSQRLQNAGLDQARIDAAMKDFSNGKVLAKMQPTLINEILAFVYGMIIYLIIDLIVAACVKKNPPMFAPIVDDEAVV